MFADCLLGPGPDAELEIHLRFLQLQARTAEQADDAGRFTAVDELAVGAARWLSWDEAVEHETALGPFPLARLLNGDGGLVLPVDIPAGTDVEELRDDAGRLAGRLVRRRRALHGEVTLSATSVDGGLSRLRVSVANTARPCGEPPDRQAAIATSFIGAHVLLDLRGADFLSLLDPPDWAKEAAASCRAAPLLACAGRAAGADGCAAGVPDHPVRPSGGGPGKFGGPVRLDGN